MKYISLTFDDGPVIGITDQVLDILAKENIPASFFLITNQITEETEYLLKRAAAQGCTLENHTVTHREMKDMTREEIALEVSQATERIVAVTGDPPRFFRPPFISISALMYEVIDLPFICGFGCEDWIESTPAEERVRRVLSEAHHGEIVLLHDMQNNQATVEALKEIIPALKQEGYFFVTVRDLFEKCGVTPERGKTYSGAFDIRPDDFAQPLS